MTKTKIAIGIFSAMFILCVTAAFVTAADVEPKRQGTSEPRGTESPKSKEITLPRYDLREQKLLTPVKNQGSTDTCWAFAANGALESALLKEGYGPQDLSEDNLVFGVSYKSSYTLGGNQNRAISLYSSGKGPVLEADDPFDGKGNPSAKPLFRVAEALNIKNDQKALKEAVVTYGAVACSAYVPNKRGEANLNAEKWSFYNPIARQTDHQVCIVGWDDSYPKENFNTTPPAGGAWIVRNSYGTSWGDGGYYYVSYYDTGLGNEATAYRGITRNTNAYLYQNDLAGQTAHRGYNEPTAWFANVYSTDISAKTLNAAGFYTRGNNSTYTLYLVPNYTGPQELNRGKVLKTGTIPQAGYHTIPFAPQNISGQKFALVVKLTTPGEQCPIATEEPTDKTVNVTAVKGESFVSRTGESWKDLTDVIPGGNVCLKGVGMQ